MNIAEYSIKRSVITWMMVIILMWVTIISNV